MGRKSREKKERKKEKLVVFVCTANVCRSPMAEKLFEEALAKAEIKKNIKVFSAGISAMDGDQASENSIQACEEIGLDLKDHRSAALTRAQVLVQSGTQVLSIANQSPQNVLALLQ